MELLDRYLQAVKRYLPWQRQDDILAELRANLESQLEEKEAGTGRSLTGAEMASWIKQLGPPMRMAARYQRQQYLIGPPLFPIYWLVLRLSLMWATILYLVSNGLIIAFNSPSVMAVVWALLALPSTLIIAAAWITGIFAALEIASNRCPAKFAGVAGWPASWSPETLPPIDRNGVAATKRRNFAKAVAEVIFGFLFLLWLLLIPRYPFLLFGPAAYYSQISHFQLAPAWVDFFWAMVAFNVVQLTWRFIDLLLGRWQKPRTMQRIVLKAISLIPAFVLVNARNHVLFSLKDPLADQQRFGGTLDLVNRSVHQGLVWVCVIVVVLTLLVEIGKTGWDRHRKNATAG